MTETCKRVKCIPDFDSCGVGIEFNAEKHEYKIDGQLCTSVTRFIDDTLKPNVAWNMIKHSLVKTINKRCTVWKEMYPKYKPHEREKAMRSIKSTEYTKTLWPLEYDKYYSQETWRKWETFLSTEMTPGEDDGTVYPPPFGKVTYELIETSWSDTSVTGSVMHAQIEAFLKHVMEPEKHEKPEFEETAEYRNFLKFFEANPQYKFIKSEVRVGNKELGICGTIDAVALDQDGNIVLIDWKCTNSITNQNPNSDKDLRSAKPFNKPFQNMKATKRNVYKLQLNTYAYIVELYGVTVSKLIVVQCHHQLSEPVVIELENMRNDPVFKSWITGDGNKPAKVEGPMDDWLGKSPHPVITE